MAQCYCHLVETSILRVYYEYLNMLDILSKITKEKNIQTDTEESNIKLFTSFLRLSLLFWSLRRKMNWFLKVFHATKELSFHHKLIETESRMNA